MSRVLEPDDPDFRTRVKTSFSRQEFMATLGASLELIEPGEVHIALPFSTQLSQQHGFCMQGRSAQSRTAQMDMSRSH